jgi:hypothetical protein
VLFWSESLDQNRFERVRLCACLEITGSAWSASAEHKQNQGANGQRQTNVLGIQVTGFGAEVEQSRFHGAFPLAVLYLADRLG